MEVVLLLVMSLNLIFFWWCIRMTMFCFGDVIWGEQIWWLSINLQSNKVTVIGQCFLVIMQPLQSVQMPIIKIKHLLCSPMTMLPNHYLMLHRHWRIHMLRNQRANTHFLIVLHRFGTHIYIFLLGNWKTIAMKLIYPLLWQQFNILTLFFKTKMMKSLTMNLQVRKMSIHTFRTLQRPPSSQKIFLECFLTVQLSTGHLKCAMILRYVFVHVQSFQSMEGKQ